MKPSPPGAPLPPSRREESQGAVEHQFVDLWRSMSSLWGISPTMAEVHGLLFFSGEELSSEDLMQRLDISRGNVSMNLNRLVEWGLVRRTHRRGDRRDYYQALTDVWEMFTLVAAQRKRREIDPMLATLRHCEDQLAMVAPTDDQAAAQRQRVGDCVAFLSLVDGLAQRFFNSHGSLRTAMEMLAAKKE